MISNINLSLMFSFVHVFKGLNFSGCKDICCKTRLILMDFVSDILTSTVYYKLYL